MFDTFEVNGHSSYLQYHEYIERNLVSYLKNCDTSFIGSPVLCYSINPKTIQSILLNAVNQFLLIETNHRDQYSDEVMSEFNNHIRVFELLYEMLYPIEKDFAYTEIQLKEGILPDWMFQHSEQAKNELRIITTNLQEILTLKSPEKVVVGSYQIFKKSRAENLKTACNSFLYHLRNSVWNIRYGDIGWTTLVDYSFNPKNWCLVQSGVARNQDNTTSALTDDFRPDREGIYFRNPLDNWMLHRLIEIGTLLNTRKLLSISIGKVNCCGQDSFLVYSSSNYNTIPTGIQEVHIDRPAMFYWMETESTSGWTEIL